MHWLAISYAKIVIVNSLLFNGLWLDDTNKVVQNQSIENDYISNYDVTSFYESGLSEQTIELDNIDEELLNATLFFYINRKRTKGRKKALRQNDYLTQACKNIVMKYSGNSIKKYKKKKTRFDKIIKKQTKAAQFKGTFSGAIMDYLPLMKISKNGKYFYSEVIDEGGNLFFHGRKTRKKRKKNKTPKIVETHTYNSFIETFIKRQSGFEVSPKIRGKQFSEIGCYLQIIQKSKNKIPMVKIIWIVGGYRLGLIKQS